MKKFLIKTILGLIVTSILSGMGIGVVYLVDKMGIFRLHSR